LPDDPEHPDSTKHDWKDYYSGTPLEEWPEAARKALKEERVENSKTPQTPEPKDEKQSTPAIGDKKQEDKKQEVEGK